MEHPFAWCSCLANDKQPRRQKYKDRVRASLLQLKERGLDDDFSANPSHYAVYFLLRWGILNAFIRITALLFDSAIIKRFTLWKN